MDLGKSIGRKRKRRKVTIVIDLVADGFSMKHGWFLWTAGLTDLTKICISFRGVVVVMVLLMVVVVAVVVAVPGVSMSGYRRSRHRRGEGL